MTEHQKREKRDEGSSRFSGAVSAFCFFFFGFLLHLVVSDTCHYRLMGLQTSKWTETDNCPTAR
jgi:hypothetical protein